MVETIMHLGLIDETEIELDKAALEIAALDHPEAELAGYFEQLELLARRLAAQADGARTPAEQAEVLAQVLATEFGFEGDRDTYDDPANADLIRVLDRRRGLPVSLAILYVAMARRLGWAAHALNTPGHVLVGLGARTSVLIDPFNRGVVVRPGQLTGLLQAALGELAAIRPEHVARMSNRAVLVRLMTNQAGRAEKAGDFARALTILERITAVAPDHSFGWWERARLEQVAGDTAAARRSLSSMLETTRDPGVRTQVKSALDALAS
jgi:regulator of sirC expression with transglutaminase-like and TPR domain